MKKFPDFSSGISEFQGFSLTLAVSVDTHSVALQEQQPHLHPELLLNIKAVQQPTSCSYLLCVKLQPGWERGMTAELLNSHLLRLALLSADLHLGNELIFLPCPFPCGCRQAGVQASNSRWLLGVKVRLGETGTPCWRQAVPAPAALVHIVCVCVSVRYMW